MFYPDVRFLRSSRTVRDLHNIAKLPDRLLQFVATVHRRHHSQMENVERLATANDTQYEWVETSHQNLTPSIYRHQHRQRVPRYLVSSFGRREIRVDHSWHQQCQSLVILVCSMGVFPTIVTYTPRPSQDQDYLPSQSMDYRQLVSTVLTCRVFVAIVAFGQWTARDYSGHRTAVAHSWLLGQLVTGCLVSYYDV